MSTISSGYTQADPLDPTAGEILIVDDSPADLRVLSQLLSGHGYRVRVAVGGIQGIKAARLAPPDLIMLDVMMPGMSGYEVCRRLKADPCAQGIPVLFLSALESAEDKAAAFDAGGADYVAKPYQSTEVLARVRVHLARRRMETALRQANARLEAQLIEIKALQASLRDRERKLRLIVENTSDVVFAYDLDRRLMYVNPAVEELTGYAADELPERGFANWLHPADAERVAAWRERLFRGGAAAADEFRLVRKDGQVRWVQAVWGPLRDEAGGVIGVQGRERDVTELKRVAEEHQRLLVRHEAALAATEVDERLRREIAEMLHGRVQTTLVVAAQRLDECGGLLSTDPQGAATILSEVRMQIDEVREREIRQASHLLHPSIIRVGLAPAVRSLAARFRGSVDVAVDVDPVLAELDAPTRKAIPESLRLVAYRVVEEALTNVYRHAQATAVDISLAVDAERWLVVVVQDDGRGFDTTQLTPGLGLSSIAGRVQQVGGTWQISSAIDQGTRVCARLPLGG